MSGLSCQTEVRASLPRFPFVAGVSRLLTGAALICWLVLLTGCASLEPRGALPLQQALAPDPAADLVRIAQASTPAPDLSGFRLLPLGAYSLDARLSLVRRAQRSLDVQYYVFENDLTGRMLMRALRDAALRGVRVRLLVDDLYTTRSQQLLADLQAHPQVQVRLFNPFCCARDQGPAGRVVASLLDIRRVNHRMHNKLLVADGVVAIAGGRNIADEYFMLGEQQNFVDMDALVIGAVVPQLSAIFDEYWNSEVVYPIERLVPIEDDAAARRRRFDEVSTPQGGETLALPPSDVLGYGPVSEDLEAGRIGLHWGPARAFADPPEKRAKNAADAARASAAFEKMMTVWGAERELTITSPYLIPGPKGIAAFEALRLNKVKVTVLTNSLAATDEPLVHTGYARYREPLIDAGVELYELSPLRTQRNKRLGLFGSSLGRLHAKTAVVDGKTVFIGSMNLDPRSVTQNTELGIFVDNTALAKELMRVVNVSRLQNAYRVRRDPATGRLQWLAVDGEREFVLDHEPESTLWMRLYNAVIAPFVPEQLL